MATSEETYSSFEPFNCAVCRDYLVDKEPRLLHCGHTFCIDCLKKLVKFNKVNCPMCRRDTILGYGRHSGLENLPKNLDLQKMKEREHVLISRSNTKCGMCEDTDCVMEHFCKNCETLLCGACVGHHRTMPGLASHEFVELVKVPSVDDECCEAHGKPGKLLCEICNELLCITCACHPKHREHHDKVVDFVQTKEKMKVTSVKMRKQAETDIVQLKKVTDQENEKLNYLQIHMANVKRTCSNLKEKLDELQKFSSDSMGKIKAPYEQKVQQLFKMKEKIEENSREIIQIDGNSNFETFRHAKEWIRESGNFENQVKNLSPTATQPAEIIQEMRDHCDNKTKVVKELVQELQNQLQSVFQSQKYATTNNQRKGLFINVRN